MKKFKIDLKKSKIQLNQALSIHLIMIIITIIAFAIFLSIQQFLYSFEDFITKIIIIDILLGVGILLEIITLIWRVRNLQLKNKENTTSIEEKEEKA
ncbi:MAG: hypothetical protein ACFFDS_07295 [Candidatus Thorarchaeota archaeon]